MRYLLLPLIFVFVFTGCSSIYYHPVQNHYFIPPEKLRRPPEVVKFKSLDGTELEGWYFKSHQPKPNGLILHFHGNAQNVSTHFTYLWNVAEEGYDYFVFDYRGFGNSAGKPTPKGVIQDARAAMHWAETQRKLRGSIPVVYFCQSLGGAICMKAMSLEKELAPKALVIDSSFASYRSVARTVAQGSWILWILQPVAWSIVDNSQSPQDDIPELKADHFLVVHGTKDYVVKDSHGKKIFQLLPEPKEYWEIPEGQHTDFLGRHQGNYRKKFFEWLALHVK